MGTDLEKRRRNFIAHTLNALKKVKWARYYALDSPTLLALAALLSEWQAERARANENFTIEAAVEFLEGLREHIPTLFQNRPVDPPAEVEQLTDKFSAQPPENPWITGDLTSQSLVAKHFPALAEQLKRRAKHGGTLTYKQLIDERQAEAAAQQLREIDYDEDDHKLNPYRNPNANLTTLSNFRRRRGDVIADFFKREATEPVSLPWMPDPKTGRPPNLTQSMGFKRAAAEVAELAERSIATAKAWSAEIVSQADKEIADAQARKTEAAKIAGTTK